MLFNRRVARPPNRRRWLPSKQAVLAGFDFDGTGMQFGARVGIDIEDLALYASANVQINVFTDNVSMSAPIVSATLATGSNGKLARYTHASLVAGTFYMIVPWTADGTKLGGAFRMQAT
jgi:hypothetical protein